MQSRSLHGDPIVRTLNGACVAILAGMVLVVSADVVLRFTLHWSWGGTDEFGSFLLVALTYLSLCVSLAKGGFHQLEIVRRRLSPRNASALNLALYFVSLVFSAIMAWQFVRLSLRSFQSAEISNALMIPLWVPRLPMLIGSVGLIWVLVHLIIAEFSVLRSRSREAPHHGS
jgi:TRAP-type C4-dicarboxylate transport system permease small subunit